MVRLHRFTNKRRFGGEARRLILCKTNDNTEGATLYIRALHFPSLVNKHVHQSINQAKQPVALLYVLMHSADDLEELREDVSPL